MASLFSESLKKQIDHWIAKYPTEQKQSAVLPVLLLVQEHHEGWLSEALMREVADYLQMPYIAVYEVATFYSMYNLKPVAKHCLNVCTNVSCMLAGSDNIMKHIKKKLETTPEGQFSVKEVECLGACAHAPVMHVGHEYHEKLTPEKVDHILEKLK